MIRYLNRLWRNRPHLFNNPILLRELIVRLRRRSSFLYLFLFLLVGVFVLENYWSRLIQNHIRSGFQTNPVRECFLLLSSIQSAVITFLIPLLSATIVNIERERETWDLLITTPINLASILIGKFLSSVLFVWILLVSLIPIYGLCLMLGGVSPQEILVVFALVTEVIVMVGLLGLFSSILCKRTIQAITITYFWIFLYIIGIPFAQMIISTLFFQGKEVCGPELVISPLVISIIYFTNQRLPNDVGPWIQTHPYLSHVLWIILLIMFLFYLCVRTLQRMYESEFLNNRFKIILQRFFPPKRPASNPFSLSALFPDGKNPVFIKDWRVLFGHRRFSLTQLIFPLVGMVILMTYLKEPFYNYNQEIAKLRIFFIFSLFASYLILPFGVNSFRNEIDRGTLDLLVTTTLKPSRLIGGKFLAGLYCFCWRFWSVFGLPFLGIYLLRFSKLDMTSNDLFIGMVVIFHYCLVLFLTLGIWFSLYSQKTIYAYTLAFWIALVINLETPIIAAILSIGYRPTFITIMSFFSPMTLLLVYDGQDLQHSGWNWWKIVFTQMSWMILASLLLFQGIRWKLQRYYDNI